MNCNNLQKCYYILFRHFVLLMCASVRLFVCLSEISNLPWSIYTTGIDRPLRTVGLADYPLPPPPRPSPSTPDKMRYLNLFSSCLRISHTICIHSGVIKSTSFGCNVAFHSQVYLEVYVCVHINIFNDPLYPRGSISLIFKFCIFNSQTMYWDIVESRRLCDS